VAGQIQRYYQQWQQPKSVEACGKLARAIVARVRQAKREKICSKQPWYQELLASLPEERGEQATSD